MAAVWLVVSSALFTFFLLMGFSSLAHAKYILQSGIELTKFWRAFYTLELWIFLVSDLVWNCTIAWVMFLEPPKELMFTARCKRHKMSWQTSLDGPWRGRLAWWWCKQLDQMDPGHC